MNWTIFQMEGEEPLVFNMSKQSNALDVYYQLLILATWFDATMQQLDRIELDRAVEAQLTLDTFQVRVSILFPTFADWFPQRKFDVKDFVGSVSERLIAQSKISSGRASDPFKSPPSCDALRSLRPQTLYPHIRSSCRPSDSNSKGCTNKDRAARKERKGVRTRVFEEDG